MRGNWRNTVTTRRKHTSTIVRSRAKKQHKSQRRRSKYLTPADGARTVPIKGHSAAVIYSYSFPQPVFNSGTWDDSTPLSCEGCWIKVTKVNGDAGSSVYKMKLRRVMWTCIHLTRDTRRSVEGLLGDRWEQILEGDTQYQVELLTMKFSKYHTHLRINRMASKSTASLHQVSLISSYS